MLRVGIREFTNPDRFEQLLDVVGKTGEPLQVTRSGKPVMVVLTVAEYKRLTAGPLRFLRTRLSADMHQILTRGASL
jgi:prevent-host-death family protein